jgi:hypothetical protein
MDVTGIAEGLKEQVALSGAPEQAKVTVPSKVAES